MKYKSGLRIFMREFGGSNISHIRAPWNCSSFACCKIKNSNLSFLERFWIGAILTFKVYCRGWNGLKSRIKSTHKFLTNFLSKSWVLSIHIKRQQKKITRMYLFGIFTSCQHTLISSFHGEGLQVSGNCYLKNSFLY